MSVFDRLHGVEYWIKTGKEAANNNDFVTAQYFFEQALKKDPDNLSALFKCASCLIEDDLPAESLRLLSKCIKLDPKNMLYRQKKGEVLEILEWWEPAKCWYERQVSENPENIHVWWGHKALCLNKAGKSDEAIEWLRQCLQKEPKFDVGLYLLGQFSHEQKKFAEALVFYEKAVSLHGDAEIPSIQNKSDCLVNLGRSDEAVACMNILIQKNPNHPAVWREKGFLLEELGRYEDAVKCLDKLISLTPNSAGFGPMGIGWYLCHKGDCLQKLGLLSQAHDCFIEASRIDFVSAQAHLSSKTEAELSEIGFAQTPLSNISDSQFRYLSVR